MRFPHASLAVAVLALALSPVAAQVRGPSEVTVPAGKLVGVPLTIDGDEAIATVLGGDAFGGFREFTDPKTFQFQILGYQAGTGYLVVSTTKAGKLQAPFVVTVKVVGAGPTPIPPGPPPAPDPPPDDEMTALTRAFRAAAKVDGLTADQLGKLASAFRVAATLNRETTADFQSGVNALLKAALPAKPEALWPLVQAELAPLDKIMPADQPDHAITGSDRSKIKTLFTRLAKATEGAGR